MKTGQTFISHTIRNSALRRDSFSRPVGWSHFKSPQTLSKYLHINVGIKRNAANFQWSIPKHSWHQAFFESFASGFLMVFDITWLTRQLTPPECILERHSIWTTISSEREVRAKLEAVLLIQSTTRALSIEPHRRRNIQQRAYNCLTKNNLVKKHCPDLNSRTTCLTIESQLPAEPRKSSRFVPSDPFDEFPIFMQKCCSESSWPIHLQCSNLQSLSTAPSAKLDPPSIACNRGSQTKNQFCYVDMWTTMKKKNQMVHLNFNFRITLLQWA